MDELTLDLVKRIAAALAAQFGSNLEVVVHDFASGDPENTIAVIENGHVSNRRLGAGGSRVALEAMEAAKQGALDLKDQYNYLTRTADGRILRSGTVYINDAQGRPAGIFSLNYDLTDMLMAKSAVDAFVQDERGAEEAERIPSSVTELLDDLIDRSVRMVGKPVAMMDKDDKIRAIKFLSESGAMLITRSGDRIASHFGISKYTLYSYLESAGADSK